MDFEPPGDVTVSCRECGDDVTRSRFPPYEWCHTEDEFHISSTGLVSEATKKKHKAVPDFIDVAEVGEIPKRKSPLIGFER